MLHRFALVGVIALLANACGSSSDESPGSDADGGSAGGTSTSAWTEQCETIADHNASCGKSSDDQAAVSECVATRGCVPSVWSSQVVATTMNCLAALPCDHPDDECISATEPDQTATNLALFEACQNKRAACPQFEGCLETQFLISDELALELQSCLEQPCEAVSDCLYDHYFAAIQAAGCTGELPFGG